MNNKKLKRKIRNRYYLSSTDQYQEIKSKANLVINDNLNNNYHYLKRENLVLRFATIFLVIAIFSISIIIPTITKAESGNIPLSFDSQSIDEMFKLQSDKIVNIKCNAIDLTKQDQELFVEKFNSLTFNYLIPVTEFVATKYFQFDIQLQNNEYENIVIYLNDIVKITLQGSEYYFLVPSAYQTISR